MNRKRIALAVFVSLLSPASLLSLQVPDERDEGKPKPLPKVDLTWDVKIPLRDGVKLHASVYKRLGEKRPRPAIVTITPYMADSYHERAMYFAQAGYNFVMVDCRGRGNSGGEFEPFVHEGKDGYDVVEWVAKQTWCNGNVGMWGGSYGGTNQWLTLKENPPHLKTIVPVASAHPGVDFPAPGGIFASYFMRWLTLTSGKPVNRKLFEDSAFWIAKYRRRYLKHLPFRDLDNIVGNRNKHFHTWLKQRGADRYWDAVIPQKNDYRRFAVPILTITGHYDGDQPGAMAYYRRHMADGNAEAKKKHYLIIGPWDHAGTRKPKREVGGVTFDKRCLLDMNELHRAWYDWTLDDDIRPTQLSGRVMYFVAVRGRWKSSRLFEDIIGQPRKFYLHSKGKAADAFHSGRLLRQVPLKQPPDNYQYDPLDVRPAELEKHKVDNYITDQRGALNLFGNGLVYHSEPFAEPTEITGYFKLVAWIKLNVPDTDFEATVYEILPDGTSVVLSQDRLRARYRDSLRRPKLVKPGAINRYEFKSFFFNSRLLPKGSRLRLVFKSPNSIYLEKNYNSGGAVHEETAKNARTAEVVLYHDAQRASYLEVPVAGGR